MATAVQEWFRSKRRDEGQCKHDLQELHLRDSLVTDKDNFIKSTTGINHIRLYSMYFHIFSHIRFIERSKTGLSHKIHFILIIF